MNPKILVAFAAGAMAAAGVVFLAMRPVDHVLRVVPLPPAEAPARVIPASLPDARSADDLIHVQAHDTAPPRYKKPSAMPVAVADKKWPADQPEPVAMAGNLPRVVIEQPVQPTVTPTPLPVPAQPARTPNIVTLRPGTLIGVRMGESLSTQHARIGDSFFATLDQPLVVDGWIIADRGSRAEGRVVILDATQLGLQLTAISTTDGQHLGIGTATFVKRGPSWADRDTTAVGADVLGAVIGVFVTHKRTADIPVETRISFRVDQPLTITERLN